MKTFITILLSAVAGAVIGVLVCKSTCTSPSTNNVPEFTSNGAESLKEHAFVGNTSTYPQRVIDSVVKAHLIDEARAAALIKNYDDYSTITTNPRLRVEKPDASGNSTLKSFFISKILIDTIFKADPRANGIRLYLAKQKPDANGIFTFVVRGVSNSSPLTPPPIFDYVDTCPNNCN